MLKLAVIVCVLVYVQGQGHHTHPTHATHTHHPHPTHAVHTGHHHGSLQFMVEMGHLLMVSHSHCYVMALTDQQKMDVKDPMKLEMLELQMSALAVDPSKQTALTNPDKFESHHCHGKTIMSLSTS